MLKKLGDACGGFLAVDKSTRGFLDSSLGSYPYSSGGRKISKGAGDK